MMSRYRALSTLATILLVTASGVGEDHWAWKPPVRPPLPAIRGRDWMRTPIDAFVLAKLEAAGLTPAAEAGREAWIRRVTYDLTGLPPTPAETDAFVRDQSADAHARVVD